MTYLIMDNTVYGMTKKQTSPTSPKGFVSKTDPWGAIDEPINPMKRLIACGATFVARTSASNISHVMEMLERAHAHPGFAVIECLSECTQFNRGSFEGLNPRRGGEFKIIEEKKFDGTPEDEKRHDPTDEVNAYRLSEEVFPDGLVSLSRKSYRPNMRSSKTSLITAGKTTRISLTGSASRLHWLSLCSLLIEIESVPGIGSARLFLTPAGEL
jgi:2-oxoglutarate ferredoxin oxidoreductase subunit beta